MAEFIVHLGVLFALIIGVSAVMRLLKQPLIIGYIVSGLLAGPYLLDIVPIQPGGYLSDFASVGIAILLFIVGLNLNPAALRDVGRVSLLTGVGQVIFTSAAGLAILLALGFGWVESLYLAVALTFSSTIIISKLLSDKGQLDTLHGRIAIGFLIVQDVIAVLILMAVSAFQTGGEATGLIINAVVAGAVLTGLALAAGRYAVPRVMSKVARHSEFLLLFSLGWCFALAALFFQFRFSMEIGALIAGFTLAATPYRHEIGSRLKPLRDFFILMFFVLLGAQMSLSHIGTYAGQAVILSAFILIGNPLIVVGLMILMGYTSRTGFLAGVTVAQISEFSLILVALGAAYGHIGGELLSLMTLVGIITFAGSTYLVLYAEKAYAVVAPLLGRLTPGKQDVEKRVAHPKQATYLIGYDRIGFSLLKTFHKMKQPLVIVDYNPEIVENLRQKGVPTVFGDADDAELLDTLDLKSARMVVSTVPNIDTNLLILEKAKAENPDAIVIVTADKINHALALYQEGADYVILPHFSGGTHAASLIHAFKNQKSKYKAAREGQLASLHERILAGHEHPHARRD